MLPSPDVRTTRAAAVAPARPVRVHSQLQVGALPAGGPFSSVPGAGLHAAAARSMLAGLD